MLYGSARGKDPLDLIFDKRSRVLGSCADQCASNTSIDRQRVQASSTLKVSSRIPTSLQLGFFLDDMASIPANDTLLASQMTYDRSKYFLKA